MKKYSKPQYKFNPPVIVPLCSGQCRGKGHGGVAGSNNKKMYKEFSCLNSLSCILLKMENLYV